MARRRPTSLAAAALLCLGLGTGVARAGEWHRDAALVCSDCHTMHNSKGGAPMRYDEVEAAAVLLLRDDDPTALCLACHRGDRPTVRAPGVMSPSNGNPPAGGFPVDLSDPSHQAHSLGGPAVYPPAGDVPVSLTCVTCHEPHGNGAYRNLRATPSGSTQRSTPPPDVRQLVTADGYNPSDVYVASNVRYIAGMSAWCLDCHVELQAAHAGTPTSPLGHPWDVQIMGAENADWALAWSLEVANRVPVEKPGGTATSPIPSPSDRVFCLSCHKAHGSPNASTLVHADGALLSSTCEQCHAL